MFLVFSDKWHDGVLPLAICFAVVTSGNVTLTSDLPRTGCGDVCPVETYESRPCTNTKDRECSACTVCQGSYYEAAPCTSKTDRLCYHAAIPLLQTGQSSISRFIEGLKVEASSNVFLEDLQNTRSLETTYYVTDMTQASDFYWDRESELRVNIGILNVHLIPEYHDVIHDGDNQYMLSSPNEAGDRVRFQHILQNNCRSPIPDWYSITLELSRERTTRAFAVTCDFDDPSRPRCLPPLRDGDVFLHRTLNEPCHRMHTFPKELTPAANSIVCTENFAILSEIFNQTFAEERFIRFPTAKCKTANQQCNKCKNLPTCSRTLDAYERKHCLIDCLNLIDCKIALSEECQLTPVECAVGDAYQYTIQPVFHNIKTQFRCHLEHKSVPVLYELFYFLQIPSIGFQTPKVHKTIHAQDLSYQQHGKYKADFLTVEHTTGLELQKEFVLAGQELNNKFNYTVSSATVADSSRHIDVHAVSTSNQAFVVSAQFENPFDYSSSNWVKNNDCRKNASKFRPVYDGQPSDVQEVSVMVQNPGEPFQYFLKSTHSPPYIRFTVPGNTSILPYYFRVNGPVLYVNSSLSVILELSSAGRIWVIHISGKMSGCPAYLGITINDRLEVEQLFRYDILVVCPAEFNLTFKVPNWGQQSHKTYDVTFRDPGKTYSVFVTYFGGERHLPANVLSEDYTKPVPFENTSTVVFLVVGAMAAYFLLVSFLIHLFLHQKHSRFCQGSANHLLIGSSDQQLNTKRFHRIASRQMCWTTMYVVTRVVYSVFMSVTALYLGLLFLTKHDLDILSKVSVLHGEHMNIVSNVSSAIEREIRMEIVRYQRLADNRQMSCSNYIDDLLASIAQLIKTIIHEKHWAYMHSQESSLSYFIVNKTQEQLLQYFGSAERFLQEYRTKLSTVLSPAYSYHRKYLSKVYRNDWFAFARDLFNFTSLSTLLPLHDYDNLTGAEANFPVFLEIEEAEEFRIWFTQFWERYHILHPGIFHTFPEINVTQAQLNCSSEIHLHAAIHVPLHRYDSTHFFGPPEYADGLVETNTKNRIPFANHRNNLPRDLNLIEILHSGLFWMLCIILDVLLLSHRIYHTYRSARSLYVRLRYFVPHDLLAYRKKSSRCSNGGCCYGDPHFCPKESAQQNQKFLQTSEINNQASDNRCHNSITLDGDCIAEGKQAIPDQRCCTVQFMLGNAIRSRLVPHLVVASSLMVSLCFLPKTCLTLFDKKLRVNAGVFGSSVTPVVVKTNLSDLFATEHSDHVKAQMRIYENQMNSEFAILKTIVLLFNIEQKLMVENYVRELCAFYSPSSPANASDCDIKVPFHDLDIPILPCKFVPVEPQPRIEFAASKYERQMAEALQQFTVNVSTVIIAVLHCLLILMAIKLILHVIDNVLFHCLHLHCGARRLQWMQPDCQLGDDLDLRYAGSATSNAPSNEKHNWRTRMPNCTRATTATLVNASPTRVTAMLFDFGYSETKV